MSYADFDFYDWIEDLTVYEVSEEQALEIIDINTNILEMDTESVAAMFNKCSELIMANKVLQKMQSEMEDNDVIMNVVRDGAFVKMHRSPKDADYFETGDPIHFRCKRPSRILHLLCSSLRIADDLQEYINMKKPMRLFISPFKTPMYECEYRIFVQNGECVGYAQLPNHIKLWTDEHVKKICRRVMTEHAWRAPRPDYCMDIEILMHDVNEYRLFEFNPLDESTDLYGFKLPMPLATK